MTLVSPGVSVTVSEESFYAPAGTGTVPLIIIATAQDKSAPDGSGTALYTTSAEAGKVKLITSQRELLTSFGNPIFKTSGGTPLHGHELNEYGLQAAYSFLGIANRAYVLRADIDLADLAASSSAPVSAPADGAYWLDTANTVWGLKRWNGTSWVRQTLAVPAAGDLKAGNVPADAYGAKGDFAAVYVEADGDTAVSIKLYEKTATGAWTLIGSTGWDSATGSRTFQVGSYLNPPVGSTEGDLYLQKEVQNNGSAVSLKVYDASSAQFVAEDVFIGESTADANSFYGTLSEGLLFAEVDTVEAVISLKRFSGTTVLAQSSSAVTDGVTGNIIPANHFASTSFTIKVNNGANVDVTLSTASGGGGTALISDIVTDINTALNSANASLSFTDTVVASNVAGKITITNTEGYDILLLDGNVSNFSLANLNLLDNSVYSNWDALVHEASAIEIAGDVEIGTLWYDNVVSNDRVDLLVNTGSTWNSYAYDAQVSASAPSKQSDGVSNLVAGDIWVDSSDLENYPAMYKFTGTAWAAMDTADQVTSDGIIFADFRQTSGSSLDSDKPNPAIYPVGIMGWNKRASGGNVKQWDGGKWVDYSGNKADGTPYMLRKAQRKVIAQALQAAVASNTDIRNEVNRFNLIAAPGYPELLDEMISLNTDRKETAFIIQDAPLRLAATSTATQAWATNSGNASENGEDGLVSSTAYAGVYYPHALTTALDGSNIVQPASHIALRTIAYSDQVSFPWFAPAGFQRGLVSNATGIGYVDSATGEFVAVALSEGQRDSLYSNKINPIANFPGRGLVVFGQKTLNPVSSALDRINVARLVVYIRERLDDIVKPFLFEPNDELTRQNAKVTVDRFLGQLVTQRGLFDFLTVCDTTNNTPARIDRNELWIDIAIQPIKAVEFIYIPIRIQNTLGQSG